MPLGFDITDRYFLDKQFFQLEFVNTPWNRKSLTECQPFKVNIAEKTHKESGSPIPWRGAGTVSYETITMKRGLGLDAPPSAGAGGTLDREMYNWAQNAVEGQDSGGGGATDFKRDFDVSPFTRAFNGYGFHWHVEGGVPISYDGFQGDANSDDVAEETIEVGVERWWIPEDGVPAFA